MRVANAITTPNVLLRFPWIGGWEETRHKRFAMCRGGSCTTLPLQEVDYTPQGVVGVLLCRALLWAYLLPASGWSCITLSHEGQVKPLENWNLAVVLEGLRAGWDWYTQKALNTSVALPDYFPSLFPCFLLTEPSCSVLSFPNDRRGLRTAVCVAARVGVCGARPLLQSWPSRAVSTWFFIHYPGGHMELQPLLSAAYCQSAALVPAHLWQPREPENGGHSPPP